VKLWLRILGVFAVMVCIEKPAVAQQNYPWCAYYNLGQNGFRSCRFATLQQCLDDVLGIGGNCSPSPYPTSPGPGRSTGIAKRHHHHDRPGAANQ
jgi:Protein of unknown function (DUF3551)